MFHQTAWSQATRITFGHRPIYFVAQRGVDWVGILPLVKVKSLLAGTMLVSMPYAIYGGVLTDDGEAGAGVAAALLEAARALADQYGARCIDLRSETAVFNDLTNVGRYVTFRRPLPDNLEQMSSWLPRKARAAARNAQNKYNLTVRYDAELLPQVWKLYSENMHRLASINYPYRFFAELAKRLADKHLVSVVYDSQTPVAGLMSFLFRDTVLPYFVGASEAGRKSGALNLIYQSLAERAVELGYRVFDFGRSRIDNTGCCNFKRFQGFEPTPLGYQCDPRPGHTPPNLTPDNPQFGLARRLWPKLPRIVTTRMGGYLAKHIPG